MPTPMASVRKSWSLTPTGERSHLAPAFLKLPISSRFLLSTLMIRRPCRWKLVRRAEICWNLLIAVGTGVGGDLLAVDAQREIHLVQKTSDCFGRDRNVDLLKNLGNLLRRLAAPLQPRDGISGRVVLQKNLNGRDYFGRFFPPACARRQFCARGPLPHPELTTVAVRGPRCEDRGRGSRPVGDRRH